MATRPNANSHRYNGRADTGHSLAQNMAATGHPWAGCATGHGRYSVPAEVVQSQV